MTDTLRQLPPRLIVLLDESCLLVYPSPDEAARDIEAIDIERELRAVFDETGVPYQVEWIRPNRRGGLGITNGEYRLIPAGPPEPSSLLALVAAHPSARTAAGDSVDIAQLTQRVSAA